MLATATHALSCCDWRFNDLSSFASSRSTSYAAAAVSVWIPHSLLRVCRPCVLSISASGASPRGHVHGEVVLDGGHHSADELEEDEHVLLDLGLGPTCQSSMIEGSIHVCIPRQNSNSDPHEVS